MGSPGAVSGRTGGSSEPVALCPEAASRMMRVVSPLSLDEDMPEAGIVLSESPSLERLGSGKEVATRVGFFLVRGDSTSSRELMVGSSVSPSLR